jgi:DnaJ-class molecular chaperone
MNYYKVLNVEQTCNDIEIKKAYKLMAQKFHPDKNLNDKENATKKFLIIKEAHDILLNPKQRLRHDRELLNKTSEKSNKRQKKDFGNTPPTFGFQNTGPTFGFRNTTPTFGNTTPTFGNTFPTFGFSNPPPKFEFRNTIPTFGNTTPTFGNSNTPPIFSNTQQTNINTPLTFIFKSNEPKSSNKYSFFFTDTKPVFSNTQPKKLNTRITNTKSTFPIFNISSF